MPDDDAATKTKGREQRLTDEERKTVVGFLTTYCSKYSADKVMRSALRKLGGVGKVVIIIAAAGEG